MAARFPPTRAAWATLAVAVAALAVTAASRAGRPHAPGVVTHIAGPTMGTRYAVTIAAALDPAARADAQAAVDGQLALVDRLMSTWRDDSEIMRLNRHAAGEPFRASPETVDVLAAADRISALSDGAFDVTVAPLLDAWGFGPRQSFPTTPSDAEIAAALAAVDYRRLAIDPSRGTVARMHPGIRCDLSAIAPGYAADRVAGALAALGHRNVLVDIGGEIKVLGRRPDGTAWRVGIASPTASATADDPALTPVSATVALADDQSLATSGDYRNFFVDAAGGRRSHVIDPRTGRPVSHGLASVTVVSRRAVDADAFATAIMVLGPVEGWALATREHLAAQFIVRRDARTFETRQTPAFAAIQTR